MKKLILAIFFVICSVNAYALPSFIPQQKEFEEKYQRFLGPPKHTYSKAKFPPTNTWYSSIAFLKHSKNIYAGPFLLSYSEEGINIYAKTFQVDSFSIREKPLWKDIVIKLDGSAKETDILDYSDWMYVAETIFKNGAIKSFIVDGSPFLYLESNQPIYINTKKSDITSKKTPNSTIICFTASNINNYAIYIPNDSLVSEKKNTFIINARWLVLYKMKTKNIKEALNMENHALMKPIETITSWKFSPDKNAINITYELKYKPLSKEAKPILGIYPHLRPYIKNKVIKKYKCATGNISIIEASKITINLPFYGILPFFPTPKELKTNNKFLKQLENDIKKLSKSTWPKQDMSNLLNPTDETVWDQNSTYWEGKRLSLLARLFYIAKSLNLPISSTAQQIITNELDNWFSVNDEERKPNPIDPKYFYYDRTFGGFIGIRPGYGSERYNDHHFHYGYFIYTTAILSAYDKSIYEKYNKIIKNIIYDIACPDRNSDKFPFLRYMDTWRGHSWASGPGVGKYGNNQESISEALNAWASIFLYGLIVNNKKLMELGAFLHTLEYTGAAYYWYNIQGTAYREFPEYKSDYLITPVIWSEGVTKNIFFHQCPEYVFGIILLPITPSSLYLAIDKKYMEKFWYSFQKTVNSKPKRWQDLFYLYRGLFKPYNSKTEIENILDNIKKFEYGNCYSYTYWFLYTLLKLGTYNSSIKANTPSYAVFDKKNKRTYVIYCSNKQQVSFSDGFTCSCKEGLNIFQQQIE